MRREASRAEGASQVRSTMRRCGRPSSRSTRTRWERKARDAGEHYARAIGDDFAPAEANGIDGGGGHEAIGAAIVVGADEEDAAGGVAGAAGMVVDVIFVFVFAGVDEIELGRRGDRRGDSGFRWWCGCWRRGRDRRRCGCARRQCGSARLFPRREVVDGVVGSGSVGAGKSWRKSWLERLVTSSSTT